MNYFLKSIFILFALVLCDVYISSDGFDKDGCGVKEDACSSLLFAFQQHPEESTFIYLDGSYGTETGIAISSGLESVKIFGQTGSENVRITPVLSGIGYYISLSNTELDFYNATINIEGFVTSDEIEFAYVFRAIASQLKLTDVRFAGSIPELSCFVHVDPASFLEILNLTVDRVTVQKYAHIICVMDMSMPMLTRTTTTTTTLAPIPRSHARAHSNAFVPGVSVHGAVFTDIRVQHTYSSVLFADIVGNAQVFETYTVVVADVVVKGLQLVVNAEEMGDLTNDDSVVTIVLRVAFEVSSDGNGRTKRGDGGSRDGNRREKWSGSGRRHRNAGDEVQLVNSTFENTTVAFMTNVSHTTYAPAPAPALSHSHARAHSPAHAHGHHHRRANSIDPFFIVPWPMALLSFSGLSVALQGVTVANSTTYTPAQLGSVALHVEGGVVNIAEDVRIGAGEDAPFAGYPSYRQNIACHLGSTLHFTTWNGVAYNPAQNQSLWIDGLSGHCVIDSPYSAVLSPLCVPVLENATLVVGEGGPGWEAGGAAVVYTGQMLFPMNATFEIYEIDASTKEEISTIAVNALDPDLFPAGIDPAVAAALRNLTQSQCGAYIDPDTLAWISASPNEWCARIWFGVTNNNDSGDYLPTAFYETAYFTIRPARTGPGPNPPYSPPKKTKGGAIAAAVIVPLVVIVIVVAVVAGVYFVRRKKQQFGGGYTQI